MRKCFALECLDHHAAAEVVWSRVHREGCLKVLDEVVDWKLGVFPVEEGIKLLNDTGMVYAGPRKVGGNHSS